jgi:hypothetical protein
MDNSTVPPTLRICTVGRATAGVYVASEWATMGTLDLASRSFNIQAGSITTGDISGHTFTASGGMNINAGGLTVTGGITVPTGNLNVVNDISGHTFTASGGMNITAGGLTVTGGITVPTGNLNVSQDISGHTFIATGGMNITAGGLTVTGGISSTNDISGHTITASGGMNITAGGLNVVSGGATINGNLNMPNDIFCHGLTAAAGIAVTAGGIAVTAGGANITGGLFVTGGHLIVAAPNQLGVGGNLTVNGPSTFTQPVTFQGRVFVTADFLSCVGLVASGDVDCATVFRNNTRQGARIECFGGDWNSMTFAINSGYFVVSPDSGASGFTFGPGSGFSDARLKDNIRDTEVDALALICATPVRAFEWNEAGRKLMPDAAPTVACGVVAQELEETIPTGVGVATLIGDTKFINDQQLTPYLMRAIQQIAARLDTLEGA